MTNRKVVTMPLDIETAKTLDDIKNKTGILKNYIVGYGVKLFKKYLEENKNSILNFQKEIKQNGKK